MTEDQILKDTCPDTIFSSVFFDKELKLYRWSSIDCGGAKRTLHKQQLPRYYANRLTVGDLRLYIALWRIKTPLSTTIINDLENILEVKQRAAKDSLRK